MGYDINELLKTKKDLYKDFADKLELTDKTDQESKPKIYNYRANIDEDYNNVYTDQVFPVGIEPRFYAKGADDSGNQSISVVDKVTEQVTNKVTENPVNPVSGTSGAPRSQGNYADGTKTMKNYACFEPVNKVAYWEELFGNPFPNAKPSSLEDIGVQLDCNDTTKDTSKDTKKRFTEPSVLPQVYVNTKEQDINKDMTDMENAKFAPYFTNRIPLDFNKEDINKQSDLLTDFNRPWDISESDNILRSRAPITEVNKEEKDKLKEETKKVHKPIKNIPISMNFPYIEDEMGLNKIYYGDMDWISMTDLSQL